MKTLFTASQFVDYADKFLIERSELKSTPSPYTAEGKAKFANHFVRFVASGFNRNLFYDWFYNQLRNCRGHIAHYNRSGFYGEWFQCLRDRERFVRHWATAAIYGAPDYTHSDVEAVLRRWILDSHLVETYTRLHAEEIDARDRAQYERLKEKFGGA